jgi:hypothetical protein
MKKMSPPPFSGHFMKKRLFAIALLLIPAGALADRPVWVTADGESYQGELDTPKEVRERAKRDAEIKAVEEAVGTFIKSHTLVSNSQLAEDLTLLFPNSHAPDNFIKAGKPHPFPPAEGSIRLKAMFLPEFKDLSAEERIKIIATRQKEELLPLGFREGVFQAYDAKSTGMINDLVKRLTTVEPTDWAEATAGYVLRR